MMREEIEVLKKLEGKEQEIEEWAREGKLLTTPAVVPRSNNNRG